MDNRLSILLLLALAACQTSDGTSRSDTSTPPTESGAQHATPGPNHASTGSARGGLLPPATRPLLLRQDPAKPSTLLDLIHQLQASTGVGFIIEQGTNALLSKTPSGIQGEVEVPADQAWRVVETILVRNEYVLIPTKGSNPQLATIVSRNHNMSDDLKPQAIEVQAAQLEECVDHPAVLVMTVVDVHPLDARQTATSLRQMMPDQTFHSILPIGAGYQLMIVGFGPEVAKFAGILKESARVEAERLREAQAIPPSTAPH